MSENSGKAVHLTKSGLENYQKMYAYLKGEKTMEIANRLEVARGFGDLSENSEYDEAKQAQMENEMEKERLKAILDNYILIEEDDDTSTVKMGQKVVLYDFEEKESTEYVIVGSTEADSLHGKISNESPVGKAVLGHAIGDTVKVTTPGGVFEYRIDDIIMPSKD